MRCPMCRASHQVAVLVLLLLLHMHLIQQWYTRLAQWLRAQCRSPVGLYSARRLSSKHHPLGAKSVGSVPLARFHGISVTVTVPQPARGLGPQAEGHLVFVYGTMQKHIAPASTTPQHAPAHCPSKHHAPARTSTLPQQAPDTFVGLRSTARTTSSRATLSRPPLAWLGRLLAFGG